MVIVIIVLFYSCCANHSKPTRAFSFLIAEHSTTYQGRFIRCVDVRSLPLDAGTTLDIF